MNRYNEGTITAAVRGKGFGNDPTRLIDPRTKLVSQGESRAGTSMEVFLTRLDKVRKQRQGWVARCPAHEDCTASLSICSGHDGRILVHCFAGCAASDVVAALGLELGDLFPIRLKPETSQQRAEARRFAREAQLVAAIGVLDREATIILCAAGALAQNELLIQSDHERLVLASQRVRDAREVFRHAR